MLTKRSVLKVLQIMRMPAEITWPYVLLLFLFCFSDGAVVRPYPLQDALDKANNSHKTTGKTYQEHFFDQVHLSPFPTHATSFQPTFHRCCQTGKRVAKKKMVCNITVLAVIRRFNFESQKYSIQYSKKPDKHLKRIRQNKLPEKIAKCSAKYPKHFVKCCNEHKEFAKHMKKCQLKPRRQRKRCRQVVKKRFS